MFIIRRLIIILIILIGLMEMGLISIIIMMLLMLMIRNSIKIIQPPRKMFMFDLLIPIFIAILVFS